MELLHSLGLFTIAIAALTWLSRSIATQLLSRDIERYKSQLKQEALEHQVRFTRIHEKQAEVLEAYYDLLRSARDCINGFRASKETTEIAHDKKLLRAATECCIKAAIHHRENELYFPDEISKKATELELVISKYSVSSSGVLELLDIDGMSSMSEERRSMIEKAIKDGLHNVDDQITPLLSLLKLDFQKRLGVETKG